MSYYCIMNQINKVNLAMQIEQYNSDNIYFSEPANNNIINNGYFYRLQYSNNNITLNYLLFSLRLQDVLLIKYFNKYKCVFNGTNQLLTRLKEIEINMLSKITSTKTPKYNLYEQIKNNCIKFFSSNQYPERPPPFNILFKVSGIWEDDNHYGITYKCYDA